MDFTTQTELIQTTIRKIEKDAYKYGVSHIGDWRIISITPDEIQIDIQGILNEGLPSPSVKITNNPESKDFPFHVKMADNCGLTAVNGYSELAEMSMSGPFHTLKDCLIQSLSYLYMEAL